MANGGSLTPPFSARQGAAFTHPEMVARESSTRTVRGIQQPPSEQMEIILLLKQNIAV